MGDPVKDQLRLLELDWMAQQEGIQLQHLGRDFGQGVFATSSRDISVSRRKHKALRRVSGAFSSCMEDKRPCLSQHLMSVLRLW